MAFRCVQAWLLEKPAAWVGEDAPSLMVQRPPGDVLRKRPCEDPRGGDDQRNYALRGTGAQQRISLLSAGASRIDMLEEDVERAWRMIPR